MARYRSAAEEMTPRDYNDAAYAYGYNGESLTAAVRGLGFAATGSPLSQYVRRMILDGFRQGEYYRAIDDAVPASDGLGDADGPVPW